jgi:hypothetical protein
VDDQEAAKEEALCGAHMSGQGGAHGTLLRQGQGRGTLAFLGGSHGCLDGADSHDERQGNRWRCRQR